MNRLTIVHPTQSFVDYRVGVDVPGKYKVILNSDEKRFGGHERIAMNGEYFTTPMEWNGRRNWVQVSFHYGTAD
jgi:1,4-alpha-glucan branching enzyme